VVKVSFADRRDQEEVALAADAWRKADDASGVRRLWPTSCWGGLNGRWPSGRAGLPRGEGSGCASLMLGRIAPTDMVDDAQDGDVIVQVRGVFERHKSIPPSHLMMIGEELWDLGPQVEARGADAVLDDWFRMRWLTGGFGAKTGGFGPGCTSRPARRTIRIENGRPRGMRPRGRPDPNGEVTPCGLRRFYRTPDRLEPVSRGTPRPPRGRAPRRR